MYLYVHVPMQLAEENAENGFLIGHRDAGRYIYINYNQNTPLSG